MKINEGVVSASWVLPPHFRTYPCTPVSQMLVEPRDPNLEADMSSQLCLVMGGVRKESVDMLFQIVAECSNLSDT